MICYATGIFFGREELHLYLASTLAKKPIPFQTATSEDTLEVKETTLQCVIQSNEWRGGGHLLFVTEAANGIWNQRL